MISNLPKVLPIFPLKNILFLPSANLPLYIFESRYLNMVRDVLKNNKMIGMIQIKNKKNSIPEVFQIGCAGKIIFYEKTHDNKFLLVLEGTIRFKIRKELSLKNGYRRVMPIWKIFEKDLDLNQKINEKTKEIFLQHIQKFIKTLNHKFLKKKINDIPINEIIQIISREISFDAIENQGIIEAENHEKRIELVIKLIKNFVFFKSESRLIH